MSNKKTVTPLYMFFGILFVTCFLISNIIAGKLFTVGPWSLTCGVIIFPISYILNDVVAEVYGFKAARRIMWTGFAMNLLMVIVFFITVKLPAPVWFENNSAFAAVLGNTPRLLVASLLAYVVGSWTNATVISKMKVMSKDGKNFGLRAIISTLLGEMADSLIFVPIGFIGIMGWKDMFIMMALQVTAKTCYEIIILPVTTIIVRKVKAYEGIDTFDRNERYNIFGR